MPSHAQARPAPQQSPEQLPVQGPDASPDNSSMQAALRGGPFAPEVQALLERAFGPAVRNLELRRGQDSQNQALGAEASTRGRIISLPSWVKEDPEDAESMETIGHEVSHALAGGGSGETAVDQAGDPGEAQADRAGQALSQLARGESADASALKPAVGGRAQVHRKQKKGKAAPAPEEPMPDLKGKTWQELVTVISGAKTDKVRQAAATALMSWCRANLPDQAKLEAFHARTDLSADVKTAALGKLQAALARNEFLLGNLFHGGVDQTWESTGSNDGPVMDHYLETSKLDGQVKRSDAAWCTSFAGTMAARSGFDFNTDAGGTAGSRSMFWSGSRLYSWAKDGKTTAGKELNPEGDRLSDAAGSALIKDGDWKQYAADLAGAKDDKAKKALATAFFKTRPKPQAGDIVVIGKANAFYGKGNSHTVMVESYDSGSTTISAVEGNSDNKVKGRTIDLSDADEVGKIVFLARLGASLFDDPGNKRTGAGPTPNAEANKVGEAELLALVNQVNSSLAGAAIAKKYVKGNNPDASVSELFHGTTTAKDTGTGTR